MTVEAQILKLLVALSQSSGTAVVRITHDIGILPVIAGMPPNLLRKGRGCPFAARCDVELPHSAEVAPPTTQIGLRRVACHAVGGSLGALAWTLLHLRQVAVGFGASPNRVQAVRGVDLEIAAGEVVALVGESGSEKSTLTRIAVRLMESDAGTVSYGATDVTRFSGSALRAMRRHAQRVFQGPFSSLDSRMTVRQAVEEPLIIHGIGTRTDRRAAATDLLRKVGMPAEHDDKTPPRAVGWPASARGDCPRAGDVANIAGVR